MAVTAEQLNIILSAKDKQFNDALKRSQRQVDFFAKKSQRQLSKTATSFNGLGRAAKLLGPVLAGAFSVRAISNTISATAEIGKLADIAGISAVELQRLSIASRTVGINQDKVSDIIKDVNDKIGDFLATGAGPMADFFENIAPKVGVTADSFRDLNGADALQLYVNSLDKANVSQAEMTFYMEALASDSTALIPLLRDGGKQMKLLGDNAQSAGRILSNDAVAGAREAEEKFAILSDTVKTKLTTALLDHQDEIGFVVDFLTETVIPKISQGIKALESLIPDYTPKFMDANDIKDSVAEFQKFPKIMSRINAAEAAYQAALDRDDQKQAALFKDRLEYAKADLLLAKRRAALDPPKTSIELTEGKVTGGTKPTTTETDEQRAARLAAAADAAQKARDAYASFLGIISPTDAALMDYAANVEMINQAQSAFGLSTDQATFALEQNRLSLQRTQDEISGMANVTDALANGLDATFMAALDGAASMEDAFRSMAQDVIRQLYRVLVVQQLVNAAMGVFGFTPAPQGGYVRAPGKASGGTVRAGSPVMTGESGRELFVPEQNGRILSPAQSRGALAGGGDGVTVVQNINVTTGVQQTVRAEVLGLMPQIAEVSKAAVLDAKRRGGTFAGAFS